ncbi:MAG: 4a-hydroxytetrahydrobiopterin dehydratase [Gracilimonas sp.]|uniref:4a-hydroxytetrahydrobiopterin dehydratase n=1 Tax=Gracilimonas sp. TaxID=1974203 RepID=UPI0019AB59C3|nr:4a-hydroxytetrahydrobiopterin dehydratase [Gracilimonas sp.]MBD3616260.1 4a-hydroxytetrahydrobiopterin dehydratase [Gracilimonas sp.]
MAQPLSEQDIRDALNSLEGWEFEGNKIKKEFSFNDFSEALGFIVRVGIEAEKQVHHPELFNVYNTVKIQLSTHDAGDKVTQKDIELAQAIESIL